MSYYNQNQPPVGVPPPQGYPPEGYPKDAYPPQGYPPQGYPPQYAPQYGAPPPQQHQNNNNNSPGFMVGCDVWDWEKQVYCLEDNASIDIPDPLLNDVNLSEDHLLYIFDAEATPVKACGDMGYNVPTSEVLEKESDLYREPSSQAKRRRMLQFESEILDVPLCHDEAFLRSHENPDSHEDAISEMSQWVAGFAEDTPGSSNECLDPSSEGWIADCFNDAEIQFDADDINASGASDVQIDIAELCDTPHAYNPNVVKRQPKHTRRNIVVKGGKSYMRTPPKQGSSIVYPFAFIKPCAARGDVTLKDINQKILNPPKPKQTEELSVIYPTSAFSGKPVVGKTKIRTEGGKGSIMIMRTKG